MMDSEMLLHEQTETLIISYDVRRMFSNVKGTKLREAWDGLNLVVIVSELWGTGDENGSLIVKASSDGYTESSI